MEEEIYQKTDEKISDINFLFKIDSEIYKKFKEIAKKEKIPKSVILRELLKKYIEEKSKS